MPEALTTYVDPELRVLVPSSVLCQYHVCPAGGVPLAVSVTPGVAHCGELEDGLAGSAGMEDIANTDPLRVTLSIVHVVLLFFISVTYNRKITPVMLANDAGNAMDGVCQRSFAGPPAISAE